MAFGVAYTNFVSAELLFTFISFCGAVLQALQKIYVFYGAHYTLLIKSIIKSIIKDLIVQVE